MLADTHLVVRLIPGDRSTHLLKSGNSSTCRLHTHARTCIVAIICNWGAWDAWLSTPNKCHVVNLIDPFHHHTTLWSSILIPLPITCNNVHVHKLWLPSYWIHTHTHTHTDVMWLNKFLYTMDSWQETYSLSHHIPPKLTHTLTHTHTLTLVHVYAHSHQSTNGNGNVKGGDYPPCEGEGDQWIGEYLRDALRYSGGGGWHEWAVSQWEKTMKTYMVSSQCRSTVHHEYFVLFRFGKFCMTMYLIFLAVASLPYTNPPPHSCATVCNLCIHTEIQWVSWNYIIIGMSQKTCTNPLLLTWYRVVPRCHHETASPRPPEEEGEGEPLDGSRQGQPCHQHPGHRSLSLPDASLAQRSKRRLRRSHRITTCGLHQWALKIAPRLLVDRLCQGEITLILCRNQGPQFHPQ